MAQVVAFDAFAPRIARRTEMEKRANGDSAFGKVIVFTGVWHERVAPSEPLDVAPGAADPRTQ